MALVLQYLVDRPACLTSKNQIAMATGIKDCVVRKYVSRLAEKGFISKPETVRSATYQGFSYRLNRSMCDIFVAIGGANAAIYHNQDFVAIDPALGEGRGVRDEEGQTLTGVHGHTPTGAYSLPNSMADRMSIEGANGQTVVESHGRSLGAADGRTPHSSSESSKTPTTTQTQGSSPSEAPGTHPAIHTLSDPQRVTPSSSDDFVLVGAEMAYWGEMGLEERQAQKWCKDFEISPSELRQQLAWARFDLVENGKEEAVENPVNWIFGTFRKTACCYPRPTNYLSPIELRVKRMKDQKAREEAAQKELRELQEDEAFQAMMADPEGEMYKTITASLSSLEKGYSGKGKEAIYREKFKEMQSR